jgi:hypothetical protein
VADAPTITVTDVSARQAFDVVANLDVLVVADIPEVIDTLARLKSGFLEMDFPPEASAVEVFSI